MTSGMKELGGRKDSRWNRISLAIMGVGLVTLLTAGLLFVLSFTGVLGGGSDFEGPGEAATFGDFDLAFTELPTSTPEQPEASGAPIASIGFPRFDVNAPVKVMGVDADGVMESPGEPNVAAWYDFTSRPGTGSNAVFSAHVDWTYDGQPGPAAFWNLKDMVQGDLIEVRLQDGTQLKYSVISREQVDPNNADVGKIVGPTEREIVTLITCGGTFNPETRHYNERTIVQAERIFETASAPAPAQ